MKTNRQSRRRAVLTTVAVVVLALVALAFAALPKPVSASDAAYDLGTVPDGTYEGSCDNGIVRAKVAVEVQAHAIAGIRILSHQNGMGSAAEAITGDIQRRQSVEVDAVSGATMSSQTIAKAVENALAAGMEEKE